MENLVVKKSYNFALGIIKLYQYLVVEKKEFVLAKQILRSGTSIGANVIEAQNAESKSDFIHKLSISQKEARETIYWLNLLKDSEYITEDIFIPVMNDINELFNLLNRIIISSKENLRKK